MADVKSRIRPGRSQTSLTTFFSCPRGEQSPNQARGFAPTPWSFAFGFCATSTAEAHGTLSNYTLDYPVVLTGVTIP